MRTIRDVLGEVGIDQKQLAREVRVTESCISYILSGQRNPSISTAKRIAAALDLQLGEFIDILYGTEGTYPSPRSKNN